MALPPRKLNLDKFVESRAPELQALHSIVSNRVENNFRSERSKRRRTTSYDDRRSKKRHTKKTRLTIDFQTDTSNVGSKEKKVSRKTRRKIEMVMNHDCNFITSGDGTKRLRTHLWHAKRFTMSKLWGFYLPVGMQGRGKGSRALLKWYKKGVLIHDASYYVTIQLGAPKDSLISILEKVLVPSPSLRAKNISHSITTGVIYDSAILHHIGAPASKPIAPVTYMWQPCGSQNGGNESSTYHQLWVWLQCSACSEGYDALKMACKEEMKEKDISVDCFSQEGRLAKLELMGSKAFQLLQKILYPITCTAENLWQLKKHSVGSNNVSHLKKSSMLENEDDILSRGLIYMTVKDPRTLQDRIPYVPESTTDSVLSDELVMTEFVNYSRSEVEANKIKSLPLPSSSKLESHDIHNGNVDLWDAGSIFSLPVEDSVLGLERHCQNMNKFCLNDPSSHMPKTFSKEQCLQCHRSCPIVLLKDNNKWSIILPLSWVRAFWIPLVNNGAHAIGLREKHWIASQVCLPSFPYDFPDTSAYSCFMANKIAVSEQKAQSCPPLAKSFKIPAPISWDNIKISRFQGLDDRVENSKLCLVRVILRTYKKGVFEEGAIVCAPYPADISLWDSRANSNERGIKLPESAVKNYFKDQTLTLLEPQLPDDSIIREYHRRQIGFITTGFVRGSQKPCAVGFCDSVSLLSLQEEQEKVVPKKRGKEIFVLVRNITSSAYRLGLASIVLEQQEEDVEFM